MTDTVVFTLTMVVRTAAGLVAAGLVALALAIAWTHPPLLQAPGIYARLKTYLTTNVAETRPEAVFPELRPRHYDITPAQLFTVVRAAVEHLAWDIHAIDAQRRTLHVVLKTRLWRFKDDVTIQVQASPKGNGVLYVRSASRIGKADFGANVRHILDLSREVDKTLTLAGADDATTR